jgi:predicted ATPase
MEVEPMAHLLRLSLKHPVPESEDRYPFSVPQIRALPQLDLGVALTFFVGENGSGKSTLLEKARARDDARVAREKREFAAGTRADEPRAVLDTGSTRTNWRRLTS